MLLAFLTVGKQVLILFLLMAAGFILGKAKLIGDQGSVNMSNLVMYVVSPCMMIVAFQRTLVRSDLRDFGIAIAMAAVIHVIAIVLGTVFLRRGDKAHLGAWRFATVFGNCGFMGYPLMTALLGTIGVFYGSAFVVVFQILAWTWGVYALTGDKKRLSWKPILLNPAVLYVPVALGLYLLQITLPDILYTPIKYLSELNTPLPMVVVGYQLSHADVTTALKGAGNWITLVLRLIVMPLITIALCLVLGLNSTVSMVLCIASATPPAALLGMFTARFGGDKSLASSIVSVHTALSVLTMPVVVGLGQYLMVK